MSWFFKLLGSLSGNVAEVDANNAVKVNPGTDPNKIGFVGIAGVINDGSVFGSREGVPVLVSEEGRLSAGLDSPMLVDSFGYAAQNSAVYRWPATTQTIAQSAGYVILNNGNVTSINTNSAIQTYQAFPVFGGFTVKVGISMLHTAVPQVNAVSEWGLFLATLPGAAIPADGVYFRFTSTGTFVCVINFNGVETASSSLTVPSVNVNHLYDIIIDEETIIFQVDGITVYDVDVPPGTGQPFQSLTLPLTARHYIGGSAPGSAMQVKVSNVEVILGDMSTAKPWSHVMSKNGQSGYQGQSGGTMGSTANYANSANPAAAVPTNTTAALGTGLGGQFWETASLAVNTDGILCSFQNPVGTVTQPGRTLMITAVWIDSYIQTIIAGGPFNAQICLAFGHTAVSLATAEAATTKAPRRIPLGVQLITATEAVNTNVAAVSSIYRAFHTPIPVYPGEFVAVVTKHIGTVGSSGTIAHMIGFDSYFE